MKWCSVLNGAKSSAIGLVLLLTSFACDGSDDGGGASSGDAGSLATCVRNCEKQADANCSAGPSRNLCQTLCSGLAGKECGNAYLAFTECGSTRASYGCTADGRLEMTGCWQELQPYAVCAACQPTTTDACENCAAASCCSERKVYWGDANFAAFLDCGASCVARDAGSACECATKYAGVFNALNAMLSCRTEKCSTECQ